MRERLQKTLARAGIASRRAAERLIAEGRVSINGQVAREMGLQVDLASDGISIDGRPLPPPPSEPSYYMLHKPRGCVTTMADPEGRATIRDLLRGIRQRVFPVGRLDYNSEGLLLLTDDGPLTRDLLHPSRAVAKTYSVKVRGKPPQAVLRRLESGVVLDGKRSRSSNVRLVRSGNNSWIELTVREGRKHQVRRMLRAVGHPVIKLRRVRFGGLKLGSLPAGSYRPLSPREVAALRQAAQGAAPARPDRGKPS